MKNVEGWSNRLHWALTVTKRIHISRRLFPEYFYTFLQSYMQIFSSIPILPPDDKIMRLHSDIKQITGILSSKQDSHDECQDDDDEKRADDDGLILITTVVTSCIRGLRYCITKLRCLEILQQLSKHTTSETVLDRILPYIVSNRIKCDSKRKCSWVSFVFSYIWLRIQRLVFGSVLWTRSPHACAW